MPSRPEASPTGTVTFLFSDIQGSTKLVERFGDAWPDLLERHRVAMRAAFDEHHGFEQGTEGDSFFVVFESAPEAVAAAVEAQRALARIDWPPDGRIRVRIGLHTGSGRLSGQDYVGIDVHRAARIAAAGHGGQILISSTTAALAASVLPAGTHLVDLGNHRLKDLPQPERLRQLTIDELGSEFPPLRSIGGGASNLPVALSNLIGRESDVEAVRRLLGGARLITVTGPGGTGKTRLVQEVARRAADSFDGGAAFVPLEAIREAELIPAEVLRALRLDSAIAAPPRDRVIEALSERPSLLVLDSLEQLHGAGAVVRDLLVAVPGLTVLASSQAALHVAGEQEFALQPLPEDDAVRLFLERARAVRPDFEVEPAGLGTINAIAQRLDGLPLAIELAAAQTRLLGPAAILARITDRIDALATRQDDLPERQRTLRATVAWSYDLLGAAEQRLLRRLSVFVGGATLADIEALESGEDGAADALDSLEALVDRSLVTVRRIAAEEHRFVLLATVRTVSRELLHEAGEEPAALADHGRTFRALAAAAEPELYGGHRRAWLDRLAAEHDNLRAAIDHFTAIGDLEAALDIAANLWRFWQTRGHLLEARQRLAALLALAGDGSDVDPGVMSRAEEAAGGVAYWIRTKVDDVELHYQRSLEFAKRSADLRREAWATYNLAFVFDFVALTSGQGPADIERALRLRAEALDTFRAIGDKRGIGESLWALGGNSMAIREDPAKARAHLAEASAVLAEMGNNYGAAWSRMSLGMVEEIAGDLEASRTGFLGAAELFLADDDLAGLILATQGLASLAARSGDARAAVRLDAAARAFAGNSGVEPPLIAVIDEAVSAAKSRLSAEEIAAEQAAASGIDVRSFLESSVRQGSTTVAGDRQAAS